MVKRRDFLKKSLSVGLAAGSAMATGHPLTLLASEFGSTAKPYDLVAIRGGEPAGMFRRGIGEIGGMTRYVKPGQTVVVKPNIAWDLPPERGANTNPKLLGEIVRQCLNAGAKQVYVLDHTCDVWTRCYRNSGIEEAVKQAGGQMLPASSKRYYKSVSIDKGLRLKKARVHETVLDADVFINVPVLKHHGSTRLSLSMKNLMGIVWDRGYWHRNDLHQCIADFSTFKKPDLVVVDAHDVIRQNGPMGVSLADVVRLNAQIICQDPVAADAASAKLFGLDPAEVPHIRMADRMKVGTMDLSTLSIKKIKI